MIEVKSLSGCLSNIDEIEVVFDTKLYKKYTEHISVQCFALSSRYICYSGHIPSYKLSWAWLGTFCNQLLAGNLQGHFFKQKF